MMNERTDATDEHPGVAKIKQMYERGDFETIDRMVKFWEAMENLGVVGAMLRRFILWSGIIAAGYIATSGAIHEWIKGIAK
jgi:hypothetical protein